MIKEYSIPCTLNLQIPEGYEEKVRQILCQCSGMIDIETNLIVPAFISIPNELNEIILVGDDIILVEDDVEMFSEDPELEQQLREDIDKSVERWEQLYGDKVV